MKLLAPTGARIVGTHDMLYATASFTQFRLNADASVQPEFEGDSEIDWDSQETVTQNNQALYVDSNGDTHPEDKLLIVPDSLAEKIEEVTAGAKLEKLLVLARGKTAQVRKGLQTLDKTTEGA